MLGFQVGVGDIAITYILDSEIIHRLNNLTVESNIHVIFSWPQIGRSASFGREIGVLDKEIVSRQKQNQF